MNLGLPDQRNLRIELTNDGVTNIPFNVKSKHNRVHFHHHSPLLLRTYKKRFDKET